MPDDRLLDDLQISSILREMWTDHQPYFKRLRVRRLLIEMGTDALEDNATGVNVPAPFDESKIALQSMIGDPVKEVQRYVARIAANQPEFRVIPVALERRAVGKTVQDRAAEQERMHQAQWVMGGGASAQRQVAWNQVWARVGYYETLPDELSWGLPDRAYFDELTDDEIAELRRAGKAVPVDNGEGERYAEPADTWFERRRDAARGRAISGKGLFRVRSLPPDAVMARYDDLGMRYAAVVLELPAADFMPGMDTAKRIAQYLHYSTGEIDRNDIERFGIVFDERRNRIVGGVDRGGEPGSQGRTHFYLSRFYTRDEIYYYLSANNGDFSGGMVIWHQKHGARRVPIVAVPFYETGSGEVGRQFSSPIEPIMAVAPLINQIETLLSNAAVYNGIPRWVIELDDGTFLADPETGEPRIFSSDPTVGLDPKDLQPIKGKVKQLTIETSTLLQLLLTYLEQLKDMKVPDSATGAGGQSGPAWTTRQQILQSQLDMDPAVSSNAAAVQEIITELHIPWLRTLDVPIYFVTAPGARHSPDDVRGLIEFDPADLTDGVQIRQDSNTASDRVVLQQAGLELLASGHIDQFEYYEKFALVEDPIEAIVRSDVAKLRSLVLFGDTSMVQPGSVLFNVAKAVQGQVFFRMLQESPNFALAVAEQMVQQAQAQPQAPQQQMLTAGGGGGGAPRLAESQGIRQAGIGMPVGLPGSPEGGLAV